mmetsp:Transcript_23999/g.36577  ORF Transcript_23999/g.36577 Transcript_23999/m.36577 type:complete len:336 (-) Transcript_23999:136-1143(-)|eukprot:CAMPEP_0194118320 /NCGR_PEP_ID=MMETSP0150-20130528/34868_1 /TAXON_ID=122233 /ORGANISM="Chaetoceros debilis, Strain MM31A-1" /LENGTH=335 /DNA_ID=CAMNT_0038809647 /DNA_START=87 /DNA_END=1094 /DNA_ORIENTATION=+
MNLRTLPWASLSTLRATDPLILASPKSTPRLAKDEIYAKDILKAWNADFQENSVSTRRKDLDTFGCVFPYSGRDGDNFSGYLIVPSSVYEKNFEKKVPVVIIFHTGAGPQDVFNRFQADKLARERLWGDQGCIIFIADIVSDPIGWTWGDRERYWNTREELLKVTDQEGIRMRYKLQNTITAALDAIGSIDSADSKKIAAWGFCLGGQPVIELGRMKCDGVLGLTAFHGLFDGALDVPIGATGGKIDPNKMKGRALICNGALDPYVPEKTLVEAQQVFQCLGWDTEVLNFENAMHNFSNPRTVYDDPDAPFGYDEEASTTSWNSALRLLEDIFDL